MREIPLSNGGCALVDDCDFEALSRFKWSAVVDGKKTYARRSVGDGTWMFMHRQIMKVPQSVEVDHKNRNGLDNQRLNLRPATRSQNAANKPPLSPTGYKGIIVHKKSGKFQAAVKLHGKCIYLGLFVNAEDAARAYDTKAKEVFGEFAWLNFPEGGTPCATEEPSSSNP